MDEKEVLKITTLSGKILKYADVNGIYFSIEFLKYMQETILSLPDMKAREDDVFVCGCHRSGTNWTWEIVKMLINNKAEYQKDRKMPTILEGNKQENFEKMPSPRILSTHLNFKLFPQDFLKKKCKIVYLQRNPKDVAVSFFNYRNDELLLLDKVTWEDYLHMCVNAREDLYEFWLGTTKSWERAIEEYPDQILLVYYEDLKKNTVAEITRIAKFLKARHDVEFINDITDKIKFSNMKNAKLQYLSEALKKNPELAKEFGNNLEQRTKYYRKGEVGDWKNHFTVAQNEYWDDIMTKRLKDSKLKFQYSI